MEDEYIIISKTAIQKRIEELRQVCNKELGYASDKIYFELDNFLSQSTPLIPEIEKLIVMSSISNIDFLPDRVEKIKQDYISNLKLDI